jgi:hypothetical protein
LREAPPAAASKAPGDFADPNLLEVALLDLEGLQRSLEDLK